MGSKVCNRCKIEKPLTEYYEKEVKGRTYKYSECKTCFCFRKKQYLKNREGYAEKIKEYNKEYRKKNKETLRYKYKDQRIRWRKKISDNLSDSYIKAALCHMGVPRNKQTIEMKRMQIKILRKIKEYEANNNK